MTPILSKLCKAQRNAWNYTGSQSLKAETWSTAEFFTSVDSMQNDVGWGGLSGIAQGLAAIYFSFCNKWNKHPGSSDCKYWYTTCFVIITVLFSNKDGL